MLESLILVYNCLYLLISDLKVVETLAKLRSVGYVLVLTAQLSTSHNEGAISSTLCFNALFGIE